MPTCLELFSGIGGFAAACQRLNQQQSPAMPTAAPWTIVQAIDISQRCQEIYASNFSHPCQIASIETLPLDRLSEYEADVWWMSPPCQPFTRRGIGKDISDRRCAALLNLIQWLLKKGSSQSKPEWLLLENVPPFQHSQAADHLRAAMRVAGFEWQEFVFCPTQLGIANRRKRFYLIAGRQDSFAQCSSTIVQQAAIINAGLPVDTTIQSTAIRAIPDVVNEANWLDPTLRLPPAIEHQYRHAIDLVSETDRLAVSACFTAAYGRSPVRSGSYLCRDDRAGQTSHIRRFAPQEILNLLGFPAGYRLPTKQFQQFPVGASSSWASSSGPSSSAASPPWPSPSWHPHAAAWKAVGNSLSVDAICWLLQLIDPMGE